MAKRWYVMTWDKNALALSYILNELHKKTNNKKKHLKDHNTSSTNYGENIC